MKKRVFKNGILIPALLLCLLLLPAMVLAEEAGVAVNETSFPDAAFRTYVSQAVDTDKNGVLSGEEIAAATDIRLADKGIKSLEGIQHFSALQVLFCDDNKIASLDVSTLKELKALNVSANSLEELALGEKAKLESLIVSNNALKTLDVSGCKALTQLYCENNKLASITLADCVALEELHCENNALQTVDVRDCSALRELVCSNNKLTSLQITGCKDLQSLYCENNRLQTLDLSTNTRLEYLGCYGNAIAAMDLSGCTSLKRFYHSEKDVNADDSESDALNQTLRDEAKNDICQNVLLTLQTAPSDGVDVKKELGCDPAKLSDITGAQLKDGKLVDYTYGKAITYRYHMGDESMVVSLTVNCLVSVGDSLPATTTTTVAQEIVATQAPTSAVTTASQAVSTQPPANTLPSEQDSEKIDGIVWIVLGGAIGVLAIALGVWWFLKKRNTIA